MYPQDYKYSKDHEWVQDDGETFVVGITDFAQSELGDVVYVELPEVGATFAADDEVGSIESVKAVAEVYTPVAGEITEINPALAEDPEKVNTDPHTEGWLFRIRPASREESSPLMTADEYKDFIHSDA